MDQIKFGVEFEMVIKPKENTLSILVENTDGRFKLTDHLAKDKPTLDNREEILHLLRLSIEAGEIEGYVNFPGHCENGYRAWSVETDPSIKEERGCYGVELVSPVYVSNFGPYISNATGDWYDDIRKVRRTPHVTEFEDAVRWIQLSLYFCYRAMHQRF